MTIQLNTVRDGIMSSMASAQQSEVKAWEEELVACEHALLLEQDDVPQGFQGEFLSRLDRIPYQRSVQKLIYHMLSLLFLVPYTSLASLQLLRPHLELVVMPHLRLGQLRETTVRRDRWERSRLGT
jgi:hypothetical protein